MYYLKCKTIIGYVGNNLEEDQKANPQILLYRKSWGNHLQLFNNFIQRLNYRRISFPVFDNPVNNIPELNYFKPVFNHKFETAQPINPEDTLFLYEKRKVVEDIN